MSESSLPVGRQTRAPLALTLVALALVAMAVVPVILGRRTVQVQDQIAEVLLPSLEASARISLIQARQMARFQAFLLTGEGSYRLQYVAAMADEDSLYTDLSVRVRGLDLDVRERLAQLSGESTRWHLENQRVFTEVEAPTTDSTVLERSLTGYDFLQRATRELERAIQGEVREGRRQLARVRWLQIWITLGLSVLAFGSTLVIARVGWRLRAFISEADRRRTDAVRARREIDAILEATGDGVLGIDLDGRCTSLNRVGRELLGYTEQEMLGRDVHETIYHTLPDGTPRPREASPFVAGIGEGSWEHSSGEDVLWRRGGRAFPARWALEPLLEGTDVRGAVLTFTDMTEIRDKEEALRKAIGQREEVVSIVSHDLRNPLGVVAAAADLLIDLPLDEGERRKQAEIIKRSADRMQRLIEDLLDVSRIEAGALVVRRAAEEPRELLEEAREVFLHQAEDGGVTLRIGEAVDGPVKVDRDRILQALSNLLDNALRFTPSGGEIVLSARDADAGTVSLEVSDTGAGIPPETLEHLFDRFWQADGEGQGTAGLGLTIVRGVARAHGGSVAVRSEPGSGSTFSIQLPRSGTAKGANA